MKKEIDMNFQNIDMTFSHLIPKQTVEFEEKKKNMQENLTDSENKKINNQNSFPFLRIPEINSREDFLF